jgi:hypothetical protein
MTFALTAALLSLHAVCYRVIACTPPLPVAENSPETLVAGLGATPYQYRALLPWIVRAALDAGLIDPSRQLALFVAIEALAWFLLAFAFRRFLRLFVDDRGLATTAALSVYAILPFNYFGQVYFPYDVPSVLLFTIALTALYEQRWPTYLIVLAVATLNRETSIFLTVISIWVLVGACPWRKVIALASAQAVLWVAFKLALWFIYQENRRSGSGLFDFQLLVNIATILEVPGKILVALATWGAIWIAVAAWYRRIHDPFLRRALWSVPVLIAAMFVVGFVLEVRIYGEMLPILLAAFWVSLFTVVFEHTRQPSAART